MFIYPIKRITWYKSKTRNTLISHLREEQKLTPKGNWRDPREVSQAEDIVHAETGYEGAWHVGEAERWLVWPELRNEGNHRPWG